MLRRILIFLALYCGSAATALAADPLHEVRKSFTIGGKPIPAEIFADFGDADVRQPADRHDNQR